MTKGLKVMLSLLVLVIMFEAGYYFFLTAKTPTPLPTTNNVNNVKNQNAEVTSAPPKTWKILSQKPGDKEGRTVIYESAIAWGGIGRQYKYPWTYVVGVFDHFETIEGSHDRYLHLIESQTGKKLPKMRVVAEEKGIFPTLPKQPGMNGKDPQQTIIMVEDLNKSEQGDEMTVLGTFSQFNDDQLTQMIKKDDAMVAILLTDQAKIINEKIVDKVDPSLILDTNNNVIARSLILRRYDTKTVNSQ